MPAAAPAKSKGSASKSSAKSAPKKTATSSHKTTGEKRSPFGGAVDELRDKRASFDQPIVDTPVAVVGTGEVEALDSKDKIELVPTGSSVEVTIGGKTVALDREGVHTLSNQLRQVSVGM